MPVSLSLPEGSFTASPWELGLAALSLSQLLLLLFLWRRCRHLERRLQLLAGAGAELAATAQTAAGLDVTLARLEERLRACERRQGTVISRVGLVRYNAFPDVGGEQSYSLALLNDRGDGVVVSSLFSRQQSWTYAKPVRAGASPYPLSAEERQAIAQALAARGDEEKRGTG